MAVSAASILTPHMWRGEPKVVIRGRFVLGLVQSGSRAYFAPNLSLADPTSASHTFATPLVSGASVSVQLFGRYVSYGSDPGGGPVLQSLAALGQGRIYSFPAYQSYYGSPDETIGSMAQSQFPSDPYSNDADMFFAPKVCLPASRLQNQAFQLDAGGESSARSANYRLGELVAPDLRIVVRGALASLDITQIKAVGFPPDGSSLGYTVASTPWYSSYYYRGDPAFSPEGVGWRATDVHIYDNPGLRGHVTAGAVPVIWG